MIKRLLLVSLLSVIFFLFITLFSGEIEAFKLNRQKQQLSQEQAPPAIVMERIKNLKEEIKLDPTDSTAYFSLGNLYLEASKYHHALNFYKKAVEINGNDVDSRNNLAVCYFALGESSKAFYQMSEALKIQPRSQKLWLNLGIFSHEAAESLGQTKNSKLQVQEYLKTSRYALKKAYHLAPSTTTGERAKREYHRYYNSLP
jgi:superkiller protein 3